MVNDSTAGQGFFKIQMICILQQAASICDFANFGMIMIIAKINQLTARSLSKYTAAKHDHSRKRRRTGLGETLKAECNISALPGAARQFFSGRPAGGDVLNAAVGLILERFLQLINGALHLEVPQAERAHHAVL